MHIGCPWSSVKTGWVLFAKYWQVEEVRAVLSKFGIACSPSNRDPPELWRDPHCVDGSGKKMLVMVEGLSCRSSGYVLKLSPGKNVTTQPQPTTTAKVLSKAIKKAPVVVRKEVKRRQ